MHFKPQPLLVLMSSFSSEKYRPVTNGVQVQLIEKQRLGLVKVPDAQGFALVQGLRTDRQTDRRTFRNLVN